MRLNRFWTTPNGQSAENDARPDHARPDYGISESPPHNAYDVRGEAYDPTQTHAAVEEGPHAHNEAQSPMRFSRSALVILVLAAMLLSGYIGGLVARESTSERSRNIFSNTPNTTRLEKPSTAPTESLAKVAAAVTPSVVSITVEQFNGSEDGSGVILSEDGLILTNNHVVASAASGFGATIHVRFSNDQSAEASILGRDPASDLAVIKAKNVTGLRAATIGSTNTLHVGDTVLAVGSPLGLAGSVTSGIVSSLHRSVNIGGGDRNQNNPFGQNNQRQPASNALLDAIQTDAAINPGNSGGALVNVNGEVVGINTAIASLGSGFGGQAGNIGVGFAIPVEKAKTVADQLARGETPRYGALGVSIAHNANGVYVYAVSPGGPADKAGIKVNDIITKVNEKDITRESTLIAEVQSHQPGEKINVTFKRGADTKTVSVELTSSVQ